MQRRSRPWRSIAEISRLACGIAAIMLSAAWLACARAESPPPAQDSASGVPLYLEVSINGQGSELIGSFVQLPDGRFGSQAAELKELGIEPGDAARADGMVMLDDLPGLTYSYDAARQAIDFRARDEARVVRNYDARGKTMAELDPSGTGSVINYGVFAGALSDYSFDLGDAGFTGASLSLDHVFYSPAGTIRNNWIVGTTTSSEAPALRLDSVYSWTDRPRMMTTSVGDFITGGLSWTRPIRMGGVQLRRNFGVRPDLVTMPMPSVSGSAAVPSTVDVFVNNIRTFSQEVGSGPFFISNIPVVSGSGEARVVVRDPSGRQTETLLPFNATDDLLKPGLLDYSLDAGFARRSFGEESFDYDSNPVAMGTLRYGLSDSITGELHAEGGAGLVNGGAGAVMALGQIGILEAAAAASLYEGDAGVQLAAMLETDLAGIDVTLATRRSFGAYRDVAYAASLERGLSEEDRRGLKPDRAFDQLGAGFSLPDGLGSLGLGLLHIEGGSGDHSFYLSSSYSKTLRNATSVSLTGYLAIEEDGGAGLSLDVAAPLGMFGFGSITATQSDAGTSGAFSLAKAAGNTAGSIGWRAQGQVGDDAAGQGQISYRGKYADAEVYASLGSGDANVSAHADGSVVLAGGEVFLARSLSGPFAVVDAGAANVLVELENNAVGRTGRSGKLLVPGLRPYEANTIAIDVTDLPLEADYDEQTKTVTPGEANGVAVGFGVRSDQAPAVVVFTDSAGKPVEPGTKGSVTDSGESFVVGYDGQAWIKALSAQNEVRLETGTGICVARFGYEPRPGEQGFVSGVRCS